MPFFWRDLIFDILNAEDRTQYIEENGAILPLTHETDPVVHGTKCNEFRTGSLGADGYSWSVWARVYLDTSLTVTDDGEGKAHPDVDFSTLSDSLGMMFRAQDHAEKALQSTSERPSKPPPSKPKAGAKRRK